MKIKVCYTDNWNPFKEYEATGVMPLPNRRIVEIELTEEQTAALERKCVAARNGNPIFETVEWCQIEKENPDA